MCVPVVDELVDARVVGADVRLGELPQPVAGGVGGRREHPLGARAPVGHRREAQLDGDGLQRARARQEEERARAVGLPPVLRVDPVQERQEDVVVVQHVQPVVLQRLLHRHSVEPPDDVLLRDGRLRRAVHGRVQLAHRRERLEETRETNGGERALSTAGGGVFPLHSADSNGPTAGAVERGGRAVSVSAACWACDWHGYLKALDVDGVNASQRLPRELVVPQPSKLVSCHTEGRERKKKSNDSKSTIQHCLLRILSDLHGSWTEEEVASLTLDDVGRVVAEEALAVLLDLAHEGDLLEQLVLQGLL
jgi:hypothetical protein